MHDSLESVTCIRSQRNRDFTRIINVDGPSQFTLLCSSRERCISRKLCTLGKTYIGSGDRNNDCVNVDYLELKTPRIHFGVRGYPDTLNVRLLDYLVFKGDYNYLVHFCLLRYVTQKNLF